MDRRSYNQYCGLAKSLDIVGERWTLLIVRDLLLGPLRYSQLLRGLPGITTNLLAKRLKEMEHLGLVERVRSRTDDSSYSYRLTTHGAALEPAVHALSRWGWRLMKQPRRGEQHSADYILVALRALYRGRVTMRAELVIDGVPYRLVLDESKADITRGEIASPEVRIRGTEAAIAKLFLAGTFPRGRLPSGITVEGSVDALRTLVSAFPAPQPLVAAE